jgi:hypothetical protein
VSAFNGRWWVHSSLPRSSQPASKQHSARTATPLQYQQPPHLAEKPSQQDRDGERARNREHPVRAARCRNDGGLARTTEVEKTWGGGGRNQFASLSLLRNTTTPLSASLSLLPLASSVFVRGSRIILLASGLPFCCAVGSDAQTAVRT